MRKIFSKFDIDKLEAPNLVQVQLDSYKWFLDIGLKELLKEVSPVADWTGKELELSFIDYKLEEPKYKERTAIEKNISYEAPMKVKVGLRTKEPTRTRSRNYSCPISPL